MMTMLKMVGQQLRTLRLGWLAVIMLIALTVRTFMSSGSVMLSGLCVAFLPFFTQIKSNVCFAQEVPEEKALLSRYLMYMVLITAGMLYLKGVTYLGSVWYPAYTASPLIHELFLLTFVCDVAFISILVPLTFALKSQQQLMTAAILANIEIGFMCFASKMLALLGSSFVLADQWGLYALAVMLPMLSLGAVMLGGRQTKKTQLSPKKAGH